jgi:hypothetical protein
LLYIVVRSRFCFYGVIVSRVPSTNEARGVHWFRCTSQLNCCCCYQIGGCEGLEEMPSLIDCRSLRSLAIVHNGNLRSIHGASLQTCTSLIELNISWNGSLYTAAFVDPLPPTIFPNLTTLKVSYIATHVRYL